MKTELIQKQIDLKQCKIHYLEGGEASNSPPILFLHGWGISAVPYREVLSLLAQSYHVIAPDLPSFAGSVHFGGILESYAHYAELLLSFLSAIGLDKVHLMGHSFGGGISITIASFSPQTVQSLVLIDSTGIPSGSVPEVLFRRTIEMPLQISLPKLYLQLIDIPQAFIPNIIFNTGNVVQALLLSLEKDLTPLLSLIQAPCLLLWSEKDMTTPLASAKEFHQRIANSKLTIVQEGYHEWCLLYPEKFAAIVSAFIRDNVPLARRIVTA